MQWLQDALPAIFGPSQDASKNLQTSVMLLPDQLRHFFQASAQMYTLPESKARLRDAHATGQDVNAVIEEVQQTLFEQQGVDGSWGVTCLSRVSTVYRCDVELMSEFHTFVSKEEEIVDEAELPPEAFRQKMQLKQTARAQYCAQQQRLEQLSPAERDSVKAELQHQVAALDIKLKAMPEPARMAYLQQQLMPAQAATDPAAAPGSAMTQDEQLRFFQSLHTSGAGRGQADIR